VYSFVVGMWLLYIILLIYLLILIFASQYWGYDNSILGRRASTI